MSFGIVTAAPAQDTGTAHVVTYIEVAPSAVDEARGLLRQLREASRQGAGNLRFETLQRLLSAAYDERAHIALAVGLSPASAAGKDAIYVVTHVDIIPTFKDKGVGLVKDLAETKDQKAFEGHIVAAHMKKFRDELLPMSGSLYDERLYRSID